MNLEFMHGPLWSDHGFQVLVVSGLEFTDSLISSLAWPIAVVTVVILLRGRLQDLLDRIEDVEGWGFKAKVSQRAKSLKAEVSELVAEIGPGAPTDAEASGTETAEAAATPPPTVGSGTDLPPTPPADRTAPRQPLKEPTSDPTSTDAARRRRARFEQFHSRRQWQETIAPLIEASKDLRQDESERPHVTNSGLVIEAWANLDRALSLAVKHLPQEELEPSQIEDILRAAMGRTRPLSSLEAARQLERAGALTPEGFASVNKLKRLRNEVAHAQRSISSQAADDYVEAVIGTLELLRAGVAHQISA